MSKSRVLLIEDDQALRLLYRQAFRAAGFTVFEAEDGQSAIDIALIDDPDVVILDLMLPKQGGLAVLKIFRSNPELKAKPIIVLTALPNPAKPDRSEGPEDRWPIGAGVYERSVGRVAQLYIMSIIGP